MLTCPFRIASVSSTTEAALASFCPDKGDACFQWGAPQAALSAGSGNLYFQLRAPTSYQWIALGTGSSMKGSSMFVVYQNGDNNITLSTRKGQGHVMPRYSARSDVTLLEGSGIVNGSMVANVLCRACSDLDLSSSSSWISAWKMGSSLDSSNPSQSISTHDGKASFSVDLQQASITSDSNPFLASSNGGGSTRTGSTGAVVEEDDDDQNNRLEVAHGVIMAIVFVVGYPIGSAVMPLVGSWLIHAGWQMLAFLAMWAGFAVGYIASSREGEVRPPPTAHPRIA